MELTGWSWYPVADGNPVDMATDVLVVIARHIEDVNVEWKAGNQVVMAVGPAESGNQLSPTQLVECTPGIRLAFVVYTLTFSQYVYVIHGA